MDGWMGGWWWDSSQRITEFKLNDISPNTSPSLSLTSGLVTSLEVNGSDTISKCNTIIQQVAMDCVVYISEDKEAASRDHDNWLNFLDSQMTMWASTNSFMLNEVRIVHFCWFKSNMQWFVLAKGYLVWSHMQWIVLVRACLCSPTCSVFQLVSRPCLGISACHEYICTIVQMVVKDAGEVIVILDIISHI